MHWHSGANRIVGKDISSYFRAPVLSGTYTASKNRGFERRPPTVPVRGSDKSGYCDWIKVRDFLIHCTSSKTPTLQSPSVSPNLFTARDISLHLHHLTLNGLQWVYSIYNVITTVMQLVIRIYEICIKIY